jgi:pimeloyl-ACP methyl ester carboxylesterase
MRRGRAWRWIAAFVVLVAIALAVNAVLMDRETRPAAADVGRILELPAGDVQVREDGPEDAPPIVLLHCYSCSMKWWEPVVDELAKDHRVIRIDVLGHGGSEKPADRSAYGVENQAEVVAQVMDRLGVARAPVVGHSMGGTIATALASAHPERVSGLAVIGTPAKEGESELPLQARIGYVPVIGQAIMRVVPDSMVRNGLRTAFAPDFPLPDYALPDFRAMTYTSYDAASEESHGYSAREPLTDRLAEFKAPVMFVLGAEEQIVDQAALESWGELPGARTERIAGVGHSPQIEAPEETASLLRDFADGVDTSGGAGKRR